MAAKHRMKDYRARLRKQGLRPVQIWVPDQRQPDFQKALKAQIQKLDTKDESDALDYIAATGDWPEA